MTKEITPENKSGGIAPEIKTTRRITSTGIAIRVSSLIIKTGLDISETAKMYNDMIQSNMTTEPKYEAIKDQVNQAAQRGIEANSFQVFRQNLVK